MFLILLYKLLTLLPFVSSLLSAPFLNPLSSPSPPSLLSLLITSMSSLDKDLIIHYILFHQWHIFCILFHTMTFFFNNAFYKLVKTKIILMLELHPEDLKKQWLHRRVGSRNSNKGGGGGLSGLPSLQIVFVSYSIPSLLPFSILSLLPFLISPSLSTIPSCFLINCLS